MKLISIPRGETKSFYSEWYHYCEQIPLLIVHWHWLGASWQVFSGLSRPFGWWMCVCMCLCMFIWVCARARVNVWEIFHVLECGKLESYKRTKASCCTGCRHLRRLSTLVRLLMAPAVSPEPINGRKCPHRVYKRRVVSANRKAAVIYTTVLGWVGVFFFFLSLPSQMVLLDPSTTFGVVTAVAKSNERGIMGTGIRQIHPQVPAQMLLFTHVYKGAVRVVFHYLTLSRSPHAPI